MMVDALVILAQLAAAVVLAPMLPGLVQSAKARMQGRRGPSMLQPYRELRRLWGKGIVQPDVTTRVYAIAPAVAAASLACACAVLPLTTRADASADALLVIGLLVLARFIVTLSAWDTGSGFSLMGAGRDLTFAVFIEPLVLLSFMVVAVGAGTLDLSTVSASTTGWGGWAAPAAWCALASFGLAVVAETGRQPIDNPDTHLELTMVHEGPLLEYAGRDLALLQWVSAARHWVLLALAATVFLPHGSSTGMRTAGLAAAMVGSCLALAVVETLQPKMRILLVPRLLLAGCTVALLGIIVTVVGVGVGVGA